MKSISTVKMESISTVKMESDSAVNLEPTSIETSESVRLVNINKIIQNAPTLKEKPPSEVRKIKQVSLQDHVGPAMCNGCFKRDVENQVMSVKMDKLKAELEQERKMIRYWKSIAMQYIPDNVKLPKVSKKLTRKSPPICNYITLPTEIPTELVKVEENPTENMNIDVAPEIATTTVEINKDDKGVDIKMDEPPPVQVPNPLLKPYKCGKCDNESFENIKGLSQHMQIHRKNNKSIEDKPKPIKNKYECYICKESFPSARSIRYVREHMAVHNKVYYLCGVCRERYESGQSDKHLCVQSESITCEYCPMIFSSTKQLLEHLKSDHDEVKMNQCSKCTRHFGMVLLKTIHERSHDIIIPFDCDKCSKSFVTHDLLRRHQRTRHKNKELKQTIAKAGHLCHHCGKEYRQKFQLLNHIKTHEEPEVKCPHCPKVFHNNRLLYRHSDIHRNEIFICTVCGRECLSASKLRNHMSNRHGSKTGSFECEICSKKFGKKLYLGNHMKTHTEPKVKCPECPKVFRTNQRLRRHSSIHRNDKFTCTICGMESTSLDGLQKHMIYIHKPKTESFECDICSKTFNNKSYLSQHKAKHKITGRAFQCRFCDRDFKYKSDYTKHLKTHLGDKIYECNECPERFRLPVELKKHSFTHYKEQQMNTTMNSNE